MDYEEYRMKRQFRIAVDMKYERHMKEVYHDLDYAADLTYVFFFWKLVKKLHAHSPKLTVTMYASITTPKLWQRHVQNIKNIYTQLMNMIH